MTTPMKTRKVIQALRRNGCTELRSSGRHTIWACPCGGHSAPVPASHNEIAAGVVRSIEKQMACLPKGWLK